jgi:hypothetical protein
MTVVARRLPVMGAVNAGKSQRLSVMGSELDRVRAAVWARFAGAKTAHLSKRQIRDRLMAEHDPDKFGVPQRLWRATVEDTVDKIRAWQQAVIATEVRPRIYARAGEDQHERQRLLGLAKTGRWREDPWLSRQCRDAFASKRPRPRRSGRIVADNCSYDVARDEEGRVWLAVMTPTRGQRLRLNLGPLPKELVPVSTIEISPDGHAGWQVIAAYPANRVCSTRPRHNRLAAVEGIDAGVSEVFTDTNGRRYGAGQYERIAARAERDRARGRARNKLRAVRDRQLARAAAATDAGDALTARAARAKAARIERYNLGPREAVRPTRARPRSDESRGVSGGSRLGRQHSAYCGRGPVRAAGQEQVRTNRQPRLCGLAALILGRRAGVGAKPQRFCGDIGQPGLHLTTSTPVRTPRGSAREERLLSDCGLPAARDRV